MIAFDLLQDGRGAVEERLCLRRGEVSAGHLSLDGHDEVEQVDPRRNELTGDVLVADFAAR